MLALGHEPRKIDIVVPVKNELEKLRLCCKALRAYVPVRKLIIPTANTAEVSMNEINRLADIPLFDESLRGVGATRALGLSAVETEFYGSIDADVIIPSNWYRWCIKIMRQEASVGACQGYQKPIGKYGNIWYDRLIHDGGHRDQGNTLLRADLVRQVGMPVATQDEDAILSRRFFERGYDWIVNPELVSLHLQTDRELFEHWYDYGKLEPMHGLQFFRYIVWLSHSRALQARVEPWEVSWLSFLLYTTRALGSLRGMYGASTASKVQRG